MNSFWNGVTNAEIATALMLIVLLLLYIAYKVSQQKQTRINRAHK